MSSRLEQVADGLLALAGDRLAPDGVDLPRHFLRAARALAEAEFAAHQAAGADVLTGAADAVSASGDASYTAMEAAGLFWTLAVRVRARARGLHVDEAAAPLRDTLLELARDDHADVGQAGLEAAARALVIASFVVDIATDQAMALREASFVDPAVQQLVSQGVVNLLRLAVSFQEGTGL